MRQSEGTLTKSGGKHPEGYPLHIRTLKLFERCWGIPEYMASLIINILRLFIFLKALSLNFSTSFPRGKSTNIITSILSDPFESKNKLNTTNCTYQIS